MVRLGLIGAGRWGQKYITTAAEIQEARLTRIASCNPKTQDIAPVGALVVSDWRALISSGEIDGVIIATPPALHAEMVGAAIAAGVAVLVEKPLTLNLDEARALQVLAARNAAYVMVDHIHLFHPAFQVLRQHLPQLGTLRAIHARAGNHGPYRVDTPVLWDWGPHDVAMCIAVAGELPSCVDAALETNPRREGAPAQTVHLTLAFSTITADIEVSNAIDKCRQFLVIGDKGALMYDDLSQEKLLFYRPGTDAFVAKGGEAIAIDKTPPLRCVLEHFVRAINNPGGRGNLDDAVEVVKVLAKCEQSLFKR